MIFISTEWYECVDFEYWKLIMIIYCHHGVISHLVRVPFTLLFAFTKFAKILSFSNDCNSGVCGPIWIIFISKERWESVDFEYWKPNLIIYLHHGVISHFVTVSFMLFFRFSLKLQNIVIFTRLYLWCLWADLNDIYINRVVWICRFWILKSNFDYLFSSWSNQPFCEGTIHIIVWFYWNC